MTKALLAILAGLSLALPAIADDDVDVMLDLYHFAGNLTLQQRDALMASGQWSVSAGYSPQISIPGVTASWSKCGFFSLPCLQDDYETIKLSAEAIRQAGTQLHFKLPARAGRLQFALSDFHIRLSLIGFESDKQLEADFYRLEDRPDNSGSPVVLKADTFFLAGTLKTLGARFRSGVTCPDRDYCWVDYDSGQYGFWPRHRFAFYRQGYLFRDPELSPTSLPAELQDKKVYRASMRSRVIDGQRIDFVEVLADANREDCFSDTIRYDILYVDGVPINYARATPDADPRLCRGHSRAIEWGSDGKPISFGGSLTQWINHGSSVSYSSWDASCRSLAVGNLSRCNAPAPTAEEEADIRADAKRVRTWFVR